MHTAQHELKSWILFVTNSDAVKSARFMRKQSETLEAPWVISVNHEIVECVYVLHYQHGGMLLLICWGQC